MQLTSYYNNFDYSPFIMSMQGHGPGQLIRYSDRPGMESRWLGDISPNLDQPRGPTSLL